MEWIICTSDSKRVFFIIGFEAVYGWSAFDCFIRISLNFMMESVAKINISFIVKVFKIMVSGQNICDEKITNKLIINIIQFYHYIIQRIMNYSLR